MVVVDKDTETPAQYRAQDFPDIESLAGNPAEHPGKIQATNSNTN